MKLLFYILLFSCSVSAQDFDFFLLASQQQAQTCDPDPANTNPQLFTGNALGFCDDEADVVPSTGSGNGQHNPLGVTVTSVPETTNGYGDFVMQYVANDGSGDRGRHYVTVVSGETYEYYVLRRMVTGTSGRWRFGGGAISQESTLFSSTDWVLDSGTITTNATTLRFEPYAANSGGSAGDTSQFKIWVKLQD
ncbi:MAG: hypothetical protein AAGJ35_08805 [Myxococcota bacterium]